MPYLRNCLNRALAYRLRRSVRSSANEAVRAQAPPSAGGYRPDGGGPPTQGEPTHRSTLGGGGQPDPRSRGATGRLVAEAQTALTSHPVARGPARVRGSPALPAVLTPVGSLTRRAGPSLDSASSSAQDRGTGRRAVQPAEASPSAKRRPHPG